MGRWPSWDGQQPSQFPRDWGISQDMGFSVLMLRKFQANQDALDTWGLGHLISSCTGYWGLAVLELLLCTTKIFFQCHNTLVAYGHSINDCLGPIPLLVTFSVRSCPWVCLLVFELSSLSRNVELMAETPSKQRCGRMWLCVHSELVAACLRGTKGLNLPSRLQPPEPPSTFNYTGAAIKERHILKMKSDFIYKNKDKIK